MLSMLPTSLDAGARTQRKRRSNLEKKTLKIRDGPQKKKNRTDVTFFHHAWCSFILISKKFEFVLCVGFRKLTVKILPGNVLRYYCTGAIPHLPTYPKGKNYIESRGYLPTPNPYSASTSTPTWQVAEDLLRGNRWNHRKSVYRTQNPSWSNFSSILSQFSVFVLVVFVGPTKFFDTPPPWKS